MSIISISARISHGKDLTASIIRLLFLGYPKDVIVDFIENGDIEPLLEESDWEIKKFADKLKDIACMMLGCTRKDLESQTFKASYLPEEWNYINEHGFKKQMTVREFLQRLGTNALRDNLHINVWVNSLMSNYTKTCKWIVTDTRYPNELKVLDKENALTIQVIRRDKDGLLYGKDYSKPEHPSECSLDVARFKYVIINDSNIKDLVYKVEKVLIAENLL
jgi:hypothetical protein